MEAAETYFALHCECDAHIEFYRKCQAFLDFVAKEGWPIETALSVMDNARAGILRTYHAEKAQEEPQVERPVLLSGPM
jgi:hypothetical protein